MATKLYTNQLASSIFTLPTVSGYAGSLLDPTAGNANAGVGYQSTAATTASGNHVELRQPTGNTTPNIHLYRINGVTISGTISIEVCGYESAMAVNAQPAIRIVRVDNSGNILTDVISNVNANHASGTEFGTSNSRNSWTATPTGSYTFADGDWIGVIFHADNIGTMAAGTVTMMVSGTTANTADTNVTFTETITKYTPKGFSQAQAVIRHSRGYANSKTSIKRTYPWGADRASSLSYGPLADPDTAGGWVANELADVIWNHFNTGGNPGTYDGPSEPNVLKGQGLSSSTSRTAVPSDDGVPSDALITKIGLTYDIKIFPSTQTIDVIFTFNGLGTLHETYYKASSAWQSQGPLEVNSAVKTYASNSQVLQVVVTAGEFGSTIDLGWDNVTIIYYYNFGDPNPFAQAQAKIIGKGTQSAQAQAKIDGAAIPTISTYGQSQAQLKSFGVNGFSQANADIKATDRYFAQAQADIKATDRRYSQAQANIKATNRNFAQAQADIKATIQNFAQGQADIKATDCRYAQANADIKAIDRKFAQAQTNIKAVGRGFSQAQATLKATSTNFSTPYAQSQATLKNTSTRYTTPYAQAQTDIKATDRRYAQANANIKATGQGYAQAQADTKAVGTGFSQAQTKLKATSTNYSTPYAQANTYIKAIDREFAQAQAQIVVPLTSVTTFAQANADIKALSRVFAQAQPDIKATDRDFAQAQADIEATDRQYAQANSDIKATDRDFAQAQANIKAKTLIYAQAQADIEATTPVYAQAQADIEATGSIYAQAQGAIKVVTLVYAQAQGQIYLLAYYSPTSDISNNGWVRTVRN